MISEIYEDDGKYYYLKTVAERSPLFDTEQQAQCALTIERFMFSLEQMAKPDIGFNAKQTRALERAVSWLKDVTDPMCEDEVQIWLDQVMKPNAENLLSDYSETEVSNEIASMMTDEDIRDELNDYRKQLLEEEEAA